eukprot:1825840-Pleurochrysis_carterae.AAC.8
MLQTRIVAATRRLVSDDDVVPPAESPKPARRSLARLSASETRILYARDGQAHTEPSLTDLMPNS